MHSDQELQERLALALDATRAAGAIALRHFRNLAKDAIKTKGAQDYVTIADHEVEQHLKSELHRAFPADDFIGEEFGGRSDGSVWIVDPIDGTTNFLRGLPLFAVSVAFRAKAELELGIVHLPALEETFVARRGHGATLNGLPIRVRDTAAMEEAIVSVGYSAKQDRETFIARMERILRAGAEFRRFGSAAIGLASVARGTIDAFWQMRLASWDAAAGLLLVKEAGGLTNDFFADDGLHRGNAVLACTPKIAAAIQDLVEVPIAT